MQSLSMKTCALILVLMGAQLVIAHQSTDKPSTSRTLKVMEAETTKEGVHLRKLCEVEDGILSYFNTPVNLSFEQSGRALIHVDNKMKSGVFQAPDCKIISRYKKIIFPSLTISQNGSALTHGGVEKSNGTAITLKPPKNLNHRYPNISLAGSSVIWRITQWQPHLKKYRPGYLIQNLKGETLHELTFPLGELESAPIIHMLDMKRKIFLAYLPNQGLAMFDLNGKRQSDFIDIPGVGFVFPRPHFKLFQGKNRQLNWLGWNSTDKDIEAEKTFVTWKTDIGTGRYNFESGESIDSVSISGDGHYIAVAYRTRHDTMSRKQDFIVILISTENGQRIHTKKLGTASSAHRLTNQAVILKNNYLAINRLIGEDDILYPEAVELFEIQE